MSILNFFKPRKVIPFENSELADVIGPAALKEANTNIVRLIGSPVTVSNSPKTPHSSKRWKYITFSPIDRAEIGRYCLENEPIATVRKFKEKFPNIAESTARGMKKKYEDTLK